MHALRRIHDGLIHGAAILAGALLFVMMATIFLDVVLRNTGLPTSSHFFTATEYLLLLIPCLGAPWMVREKGHVYVEVLIASLRPALRNRMIRFVGIASAIVCLVLAWYGTEVTIRSYLLAEKDSRSFDMPRWILVGFIPLSFLLMAGEFLRFLVRDESPIATVPLDPVPR